MSKGSITISVDSSQLKAMLRFTSDRNAEEATKEKVTSAFAEAGIGNLLNARKLESILSDLSKVKTGVKEIVIAEGIPPKLAVDSEIDFTEFGFTDEYTPEMAQKLFDSASYPIVYSIEQTSKKIERVVTKKKALPFLKPVEEKTVSYEKVEKKERVSVDPTMDGCGYVKQDEILAIIKPGIPGKDGMSISGKAIKTTRPKIVKLFVSDNIRMTGNKATSAAAGFVRRGKDWIEIFPYREHKLDVDKSSDNSTCLINFFPGTAGARDVEIESVYTRCKELGIEKETLLPQDEIGKIIADAIKSGIAVKDASISIPTDSSVRLNISGDSVRASLSITKGRGSGKQINLKSVLDLLSKSGLAIKSQEKIKAEITRFLSGSERELADYPVCEGRAPEKGTDGKLAYFVAFVTESERDKLIETSSRNIGKGNTFDSLRYFPLERVEKIALVKKGMKIADLVAPTTGNDGIDVYGNRIPGIKGKEAEVILYENLERNADSINAASNGILDSGVRGDSIALRVRRFRNGKLDLAVSEDKMNVFLSITQGDGGGEMVVKENVIEALAGSKIVKGIKNDILESVFRHLSPGEEVKEIKIAEGNKSIQDASNVVFRVKMAGRKSEGRVKKNDLLVEIFPARGAGSSGFDVFGNTPKSSDDSGFGRYIAGEQIRKQQEPDGRILFYADGEGVLALDKHILRIINVRYIDGDLDSKIGDLQVTGSVHIRGNVMSGIKVFATGDIVVEGNVMGAVLSAGGAIKILGDIQGEGKAIIRAKKRMEARLASEAYILSVGDIILESDCLRCNVKCNGKIFVNTKKGSIIGGKIKASKGIDAFNIGTTGTKTEISFGQDYLLSDKIETEEKKISKFLAEIARIDGIVNAVKSGKSVPAMELVKLRQDKFNHLKTIENIKKDILHLRDRFELHFPASEIVVHGTLSPDTVIESHMRNFEIQKAIEKVILLFNQTNGWIEQTFFI